jgi:hypothetical protein
VTQNAPYGYVTSLQAQQALALRLNDTAMVHWVKPELQVYLWEALREWNSLTGVWEQDWGATYTAGSLPWQSTANLLNALVGANPTSPRTQTLNDSYVYTVAQYHLLEEPNGNAAWTGTSQFSLSDFTQALQRRRDAILQATACNVGPFSTTFGLPAGSNRVQLPDTTSQSILDVRRIRYVPATGLGDPSTLWREDGLAFEYFNNAYEQTVGTPLGWDVLAGPPLYISFDASASVPNTLDMLVMLSGGLISPPTASPLLIPDDWYWVLKFGMMADLLRKESEATDLERAAYCEQRYQDGLKLMREMPWILQAQINGVPCDTPPVEEADWFDYEWQSNPSAQIQVVRGGIDLFAVSPTVTANTSVLLKLVGNAPIPADDTAFLQVSRDVLNVILDEAEHLAQFKHGGAEFRDSMALRVNFLRAAVETNSRLEDSGIFAEALRPQVSRQEQAEPRFAMEAP